MNRPDELDLLLATFRPDADALNREWPSSMRQCLREQVMEQPPTEHRSLLRAGRRPLTYALAMAVAASVTLAATGLLPAGTAGGPSTAGATALTELAFTAVGARGLNVGPTQYQYSDATETQVVGSSLERGVTRYRTWQNVRGDAWVEIIGGATPGCRFRPADAPPAPPGSTNDGNSTGQPPQITSFAKVSQAFLASLPTDPGKLSAYLAANGAGQGGHDAVVFAAVKDIVTYTIAPPPVRAAAIRVLSTLGHVEVSVHATDPAHRAAIEVDFHNNDAGDGFVDSLYFDPHTSQLLAETQSQSGSELWTRVIDEQSVTSSLPAAVRACVNGQK